MKRILKYILSFCLLWIFYIIPIYLISALFGFLILYINNYNTIEAQPVGWIIIIISLGLSIIASSILSFVTTKKIINRGKKENGTREKLPKYITTIIVISLILNIIILTYSIITIYRNNNDINNNNIESKEIIDSPTIYNIDASSNYMEFANFEYISNNYREEIRNNYTDNYIINFENISFNNKINTISYEIRTRRTITNYSHSSTFHKEDTKRIIKFNNKLIDDIHENEQLLGIDIYDNYLKISEMIDSEFAINKEIYIDKNEDVLYNIYEISITDNTTKVLEVVNKKNKNDIKYKTYDLYFDNNILVENNLMESSFDCDNFKDYNSVSTSEDEIKYYVCNY